MTASLADKKLNEPKLLTGVVDFMVSEDFFINFLRVYGSKSPTGVVVANLSPRVIDSKGLVGFT